MNEAYTRINSFPQPIPFGNCLNCVPLEVCRVMPQSLPGLVMRFLEFEAEYERI